MGIGPFSSDFGFPSSNKAESQKVEVEVIHKHEYSSPKNDWAPNPKQKKKKKMGLGPTRWNEDGKEISPSSSTGNPNPSNYSIYRSQKIKNHLVLWLNYPDCLNFEGDKIMVFSNVDLNALIKQGSIDPHFQNKKSYISPIARFLPTAEGWKIAIKFAEMLK